MSLVVLHGFTQNGAVMRADLAGLTARLAASGRVQFPDAPHDCAEESVARLYAAWGVPRKPGPYRTWWDATDDGREYRGLEETRALMQHLLSEEGPVGVLGFSQGAMLAATVAALAEHGELPRPRFVVLVAGRPPRADVLQPYFGRAIRVPSLHVWGDRDGLAAAAPALVERFDPESRECVTWPGPHAVPVTGAASDAIVRFVEKHGG